MNKSNIYIIIAAFLATFLIGGFVGYKLKKCPEIESTVTKVDTVYRSYPINDTFIVTKPVNKFVHTETIKQVLVTEHDTLYIDYPQWESTDTLKYEGLSVAISDIGDCNGIWDRKSNFSGTLKERVITKEIINNVSIPPPFISLNAGASASFSGKWKAFDVGPAVSLSIRQRHNIGYSYGLNSSTHNITLQTKIK